MGVVVELIGAVLVLIATLFMGWRAYAGPMKSIARAWVCLVAVVIAAAVWQGTEWAAMLAASVTVFGVPLAGLLAVGRRKERAGGSED